MKLWNHVVCITFSADRHVEMIEMCEVDSFRLWVIFFSSMDVHLKMELDFVNLQKVSEYCVLVAIWY